MQVSWVERISFVAYRERIHEWMRSAGLTPDDVTTETWYSCYRAQARSEAGFGGWIIGLVDHVLAKPAAPALQKLPPGEQAKRLKDLAASREAHAATALRDDERDRHLLAAAFYRMAAENCQSQTAGERNV